MHIEGAPSTTTDGTGDPVAALDGLLPGLAAGLLDLLDAVDDRCECGLDAHAVLARVFHRVRPGWQDLPVEVRVLTVLDAVRVVLAQG